MVMTDGHFVPSDTGSKPVVDIVFSNVMHDWVGSNRIVEVILSVAKCCTLLIKLDNYFDWRSWLYEIY
jgi:hypothetical protein|nr:MAG TPA: hypothetical protein [Bacteriophage sp.]